MPSTMSKVAMNEAYSTKYEEIFSSSIVFENDMDGTQANKLFS